MVPALASSDADAQPAPNASRLSAMLPPLVLAVQTTHLAVLLLLAHPAVASNVLQMLAAGLSAIVCIAHMRQAGDRRLRRLWFLLGATFVLWNLGQVVYLGSLLHLQSPFAVACMDAMWLAFALPILVLAAHPSDLLRGDPVGWLDAAQACALFAVIFVLVYPHPGILRVPAAYDVENIAMTLAVLLRFSIAQRGEERDLFRVAVIFAASYTAGTFLDDALSAHGVTPGTLIDLCWSTPFTLFSAVALLGKRAGPRFARWSASPFSSQRHLQGFSALGMAMMALVGSAAIARHMLLIGLPLMAFCFLVFAARTSLREFQLHHAHARLEHASLHDPLTGLANRASLQQTLTRALAGRAGSMSRRGVALLYVDLDRFKTINDGLGYVFGDLLLIEVGRRLRSVAGPGDEVARHGGDEFMVLLDGVDEAAAKAAAECIIDCLRRPLTLEGRVIHVTASVGFVLSESQATAETMLQDADCAMQRAKSCGKDRIQRFAPRMLEAARNKLELETALRRSLAEGQVEVHYQPIYGLPDQRILGLEALARWRHPERGMISPEEFIPIAEDTGLILELGRQVMRQACFQCAAWNLRLHSQLHIGVNVSAHQFSNPKLLEEIFGALRDSRLDPTLLKLEITESVLMNHYQAVEEVLNKARAAGIGICLDDFGTGYSSLSYLLQFPFDLVKIDRSFVRHLDRDPRRAEMVRMILQMAAGLKKKTIAEGVESEQELLRLTAFGADMVQGFMLSRPLNRAAAEDLLLACAVDPSPAALAGARKQSAHPAASYMPGLQGPYPVPPLSADAAEFSIPG